MTQTKSRGVKQALYISPEQWEEMERIHKSTGLSVSKIVRDAWAYAKTVVDIIVANKDISEDCADVAGEEIGTTLKDAYSEAKEIMGILFFKQYFMVSKLYWLHPCFIVDNSSSVNSL